MCTCVCFAVALLPSRPGCLGVSVETISLVPRPTHKPEPVPRRPERECRFAGGEIEASICSGEKEGP